MPTPIGPLLAGLALGLLTPILPLSNSANLTPLTGSRIWVTGTSTVRSFSCNAVSYGLGVEAAVPNAADAVVAGEKAVGLVDLRIPVASMDCANGTMNEHMREALKAEHHPTIRFTLSSYSLVKAGDHTAVTLRGALTIGGVEQAVVMPAVASSGGAGVLHLTGEYEVRMSTFGLKPPSLMFGAMKVGNDVQVHFDLLLGGQPAAVIVAAPVKAPARVPVAAPTATPDTTPRDAVASSTAQKIVLPEVFLPAVLAPTPEPLGAPATSPVGAPTAAPATPTTLELTPAPPPPVQFTTLAPSAQTESLRAPTEPRMDARPFDEIVVTWGAAFAQDFQYLKHRNTAAANIVGGVDSNELIGLGGGFNTAMANLSLNARLTQNMHVELVMYLSTRHHTNAWVKGGHLQMEGSPLPLPYISDLMKNVIVRVGQFEVNYGDAHFRRTDGGNGMDNPFIGNLILDAFSTEIGADATYRNRGWIVMAGFTGGGADGQVTEPGQHTPAILAKVAYDTTTAGGIHYRIAGSMYSNSRATHNVLYSGDRAGSHYFDVMENTTSSESADAWSGNIQPGFTNHVLAFVLNPMVSYRNLELLGNIETATGSESGAAPDRTWRQQSLDAVYRVLDDHLYVAARFNRATGEPTGTTADVDVRRIQLGAGLFLTRNVLAKIEYVSQTYAGFVSNNILNGGRFRGIMLEGAVRF